jgi:hypothetical protein
VADLERHVSRVAPLRPGFYQRVYESACTIPPGEGVDQDGIPGRNGEGNTGGAFSQFVHFLGKYQPYGIYIPEGDGPHGLHLVLHGHSANHSSLVSYDGMQQRIGDDLDRIRWAPSAAPCTSPATSSGSRGRTSRRR